MSFERLQDKIREMNNPTVAGLDPKLEYIPAFILEGKAERIRRDHPRRRRGDLRL